MSTRAPGQSRLRNQPPDPHPRKPRIAVPDMAWDCHIHLFGPMDEYPFADDSPYVSDDALPEHFLAMQQVLGIKRAVIVSAGGYGADYRHLRSVLERFGEHFRGVILPHPEISPDEIAELDALGVRGVRMFGGSSEWNHLPRVDPRIAAMIDEAGWHVQYHSLSHGALVDVADRLLALPNKIVIDHFGAIDAAGGFDQPAFICLLRLLDSGKVWLKLSAPMRSTPGDYPYAAVTPFARALVAHAPERLVWGSDWPHVQMNGRLMPNDGDLLDLLTEWAPDAATRKRILVDNPVELYA